MSGVENLRSGVEILRSENADVLLSMYKMFGIHVKNVRSDQTALIVSLSVSESSSADCSAALQIRSERTLAML